jgi:hypothetical protein
MSDLPTLFPGSAGADFSAVIGVRVWVFGFVAYRDWTEVLLGEEVRWFALPSWLTGVSFFALALAEWTVLRLLAKGLRRLWRHRRAAAAGVPG